MAFNPRFVLRELNRTGLFQEIREVASRILPEYNIDDPNDLGRFLIEVGIGLAENNNYSANNWANEAFVTEVRDPFSAFLHAYNYNYRPDTAQPPRVEQVTITLNQAHTSSITIPAKALKISNSDESPRKFFYENIDEIIIPSGTTQIQAAFIEGETVNRTFTSSGEDFQTFRLPETNVIVDPVPGPENNYGVVIEDAQIGTGNRYEVVPDFLFSGANDFHVVLKHNANGTVDIRFGDQDTGSNPPALQEMFVRYRIGGTSVNIESGQLDEVIDEPSLPSGIEIDAVINDTESFGGSEQTSVDFINKAVPVLGSDRERVMDREDIEFLANSVAGVARVKVVNLFNVFNLIVVPPGAGTPPQTIIDRVDQQVKVKLAIGYGIVVEAPSYREVDRKIVGYTTSDFSKTDVFKRIRKLTNNFLDPLAEDDEGNFLNRFGGEFSKQELGFRLKELNSLWDYEIQEPASSFALNPTEVLTSFNTKVFLNVTGHGSGTDLFLTTNAVGSFMRIVRFQIIDGQSAGNSTLSSQLNNNSPASVDYIVTTGTNAGESSVSAIRDFINNDPNLAIAVGTTLGTFEIYEPFRLLRAESDDSTVDDASFSFDDGNGNPVPMDASNATFFDIVVNGGV